jgi:hypothetical protein
MRLPLRVESLSIRDATRSRKSQQIFFVGDVRFQDRDPVSWSTAKQASSRSCHR